MPARGLSDNEVVAIVLSRSRVGAEWLYDRYAASLYRVIFLHVQNQAVAERLLEDVFVEAWNNIEEFEPSEMSLNIWLAGKGRKAAKALINETAPVQQEIVVSVFPDLDASFKLA
jgi:DNA-directed RNA polymerase specialized sigma24 family protein